MLWKTFKSHNCLFGDITNGLRILLENIHNLIKIVFNKVILRINPLVACWGIKMEVNNRISLVIFDMDGLMFDTEKLAVENWVKAGKTARIEITEQIVYESLGLDINGAEKLFKKYLGNDFPYHQLRALRLNYTNSYIEKNGVPVKKGLYELLDFLDERGILKAVATSTERIRAEQLLHAANVKKEFDCLIYGDEVLRGKPQPDIFLEAARQLNCKPNECLVLEDSLNGIIAASKADMMPIIVSESQILEDVERITIKKFTSLLEVKHFLEELNL